MSFAKSHLSVLFVLLAFIVFVGSSLHRKKLFYSFTFDNLLQKEMGSTTSDTQPTSEELADLTLCAQRLWDLDDNRLQPEVDYRLNPQEGKRVSATEDVASRNLFTEVSESALQRQTYARFISLLDNYERESGITENLTGVESQEISDFTDALLASRPIQYVRNYLISNGTVSDEAAFRGRLYDIWFDFYEDNAPNDTSGFEHVFVGESDSNRITGFHNWIQYYREERRGSMNYLGYILPSYRSDPPDAEERILSIQFTWDGELKRRSTIFIGSSPEFEIALYTLYFLAGEDRTRVTLLNYSVEIRCFPAGSGQIGTAYPAIMNEF